MAMIASIPHIGHLQVDQDYIRALQCEFWERLPPRGGFGDQLHVGFSANQSSDSLPKQRMVVRYEDPDGFFSAVHVLACRGIGTGQSGFRASWPIPLVIILRRSYSRGLGPKEPSRRRTLDAPYATEAETVNSTSVPAPLSLHTLNCAPIRLARSRIPGKPK